MVGEFPYSENAGEGQGKCGPKNYIVVTGLREVAKKAEEMWPGEGRSYPALRFIVVSFDPLDGLF